MGQTKEEKAKVKAEKDAAKAAAKKEKDEQEAKEKAEKEAANVAAKAAADEIRKLEIYAPILERI